ncbi:hypothetical protein SNEBB_001535 [Seison nebaliae]|nr:hypothetical protein SNEBB_001535 [Seison nebaliae]
MKINLTKLAFLKIWLHRIKYSHLAVNGLLIGKDVDGVLFIEDAIPLFHNSPSLNCMIDIAMIQISCYAKDNNLILLGLYYSSENVELEEYPDINSIRIANIIKQNSGLSCIVTFKNNDNSQLIDVFMSEKESENDDIKQNNQQKWKRIDKENILYDTEININNFIDIRLHQSLVDFDNHLDNIEYDWRNEDVREQIENLTK